MLYLVSYMSLHPVSCVLCESESGLELKTVVYYVRVYSFAGCLGPGFTVLALGPGFRPIFIHSYSIYIGIWFVLSTEMYC